MRSKKLVIALVAVVCLAAVCAVGVAVGLSWNQGGGQGHSGGVTLSIDPNAEDWHGTLPEPEETAAAEDGEDSEVPTVQIPGYGALEFVAGATEQDVSFVNPEGNGCYFIISIALSDGTVIYTSQLIPPGQGLYHITLDQPLEAGVYENAQLQYRCISLEDQQTEYNGANVNLTLRVR